MNRVWTCWVALAVLEAATVARAEPPQRSAPAPAPAPASEPQEAQEAQEPVVLEHPPTATPVYVEPGPAQAEPAPAPEPEPAVDEGRGIQYGVWFLVPYFIDREMGLGPGWGFQLRVGWEFPSGLSFELGWQLISVSGHDPSPALGVVSDEVDVFAHYTTLGMRYAFLNPSALVPFLGAGAALSYWTFDPSKGSGTGAVTFNAVAGFIYEVSAQVGIELGVQLDYTLSGDVGYFQDDEAGPQLWMAPFVGATLYY